MTISTIPCCSARFTIPKSNGPAKNSGKMVSKSKRIIRFQVSGFRFQVSVGIGACTEIWNLTPDTSFSQVKQPFRRIDHDPFPLGRDLDANTQDERDQQFAGAVSDYKQRRGAVIPHLFDATEPLTFNSDYL